MKDEALKLALEALETAWTYDEDNADGYYMEAITAIKQTLAAPVQEPVAWMFQHGETGRMNYLSNDGMNSPSTFVEMNPRYALVCPLYTTPPAAQQSDVDAMVALARADEREQIARMIEDAPPLVEFAQNDQGGCMMCGFTPKLAAKTIRARGNT
jgi:hypothetical protein